MCLRMSLGISSVFLHRQAAQGWPEHIKVGLLPFQALPESARLKPPDRLTKPMLNLDDKSVMLSNSLHGVCIGPDLRQNSWWFRPVKLRVGRCRLHDGV